MSEADVDSVNAKTLTRFINEYLPAGGFWKKWQYPRSGKPFTVSLTTAGLLTASDFEACFQLISLTSSHDYANSSVGWKPRAKKKEMRSDDLKYVLVKDNETDEIEAFLSFMPTMEDDRPVLYCYEIHCKPNFQGAGLGSVLMDLLENLGKTMGLVEKTMLSCFTHNERAVRFYENRGYEVDAFSPAPRTLRSGAIIESDYIIMSKYLD